MPQNMISIPPTLGQNLKKCGNQCKTQKFTTLKLRGIFRKLRKTGGNFCIKSNYKWWVSSRHWNITKSNNITNGKVFKNMSGNFWSVAWKYPKIPSSSAAALSDIVSVLCQSESFQIIMNFPKFNNFFLVQPIKGKISLLILKINPVEIRVSILFIKSHDWLGQTKTLK